MTGGKDTSKSSKRRNRRPARWGSHPARRPDPPPIILSIDAFAARRGVKPATVRRWIRTGKLTRGLLPDDLVDAVIAEDELVGTLSCRQAAQVLTSQLAEMLRIVSVEVSKAAADRGPHKQRNRLASLLPAIKPEVDLASIKVRLFRAVHFQDFDQAPPPAVTKLQAAAPAPLTPISGPSILDLMSRCSIAGADDALTELQRLLAEEMTLQHRHGELMRKWAALVGRIANPGSASPEPQLSVIV
jgi:hypothetical protein